MKNQSPGLGASLGLFTATMLVMGTIIGSGIFKKIAPMTMKLQSPEWVMVAWIIAGTTTLFAAFTYAELASRLAQTGGQYAYLRTIYGPFVGFLFGWASFSVIQSASIASVAYVFAEALTGLLPTQFALSVATVGGVKVIAILAVWFLTLINFRGVDWGAWLENIFTVLKVLGILLVVGLAIYFARANVPAFATTEVIVAPAFSGAFIGLMFSAMMGAFWAFDGIHNIGFLGGEIKNPTRNIPLALMVGVTGILLLYLVVNFVFFKAVSVPEVLQIAERPNKIFAVEMISDIAGGTWALFVSILILVSTFGTTNGSILSSSRIYYAMAQDGVFFSALGRAHEKYQTPHLSLFAQAGWASLLILSGTFEELTDLLIFAAFLFYGLGAYGLFILRRRAVGQPRFQVPSIIPVVYIIFCVSLVVINIVQNPTSSLIGMGLILSGVPIYFWRRGTPTH